MRTFVQSILPSAAICAIVILAAMPPSSSVAASSKSKDRGAELFATNGCAFCHGTAGVGGGKGPDLQLVRKRLNASQISAQIHNGGKSMPPYSDKLTSAQIDDLIAFLRAKRKVIVAAPKPPPEPQNSDPN